ncbi:MAG: NADH-quinone oxidoreductase subunit J [Chloroflexi bacterium]|nr:NADH-quinone oxidoreductase subunit J [Chloroflexota bacterium]
MDYGYSLSFYALAGLTVLSSLLVVSLRNIFHAALFLVLAFVGIAGIYLTLNAAFLAVVQVLIYAGAIAVLMLFAIFLTRNAMAQGNPPGRLQASALITAGLMFIALAYSFANSRWAPGPATPPDIGPELLAKELFTTFAFPFEVASVLLLVAMLGAILLARE